MKVYKFGGASVRSAEGVENLRVIVAQAISAAAATTELAAQGSLFVIVSAMGKTTNALEKVTERFVCGDRAAALELAKQSEEYHAGICGGLFPGAGFPESVRGMFDELKALVSQETAAPEDYDYWYDRIVSYGELVSTRIVSEYLARTGVDNKWIDIRGCFVTDPRHRDANVDLGASGPLLRKAVAESGDNSAENDSAESGGCGVGNGGDSANSGGANDNGGGAIGDCKIFVSQGFIGADGSGATTTLGREGSDYSAAVVANLLDAESLTIWKDVVGVMNGDPKIFPDAVHIPELTYLDAVELAYSGAQIIHPKTIKPLQNKDIPLYVRSFAEPAVNGSVIRRVMDGRVEIPVMILKHNQVLISIRPLDFSFVLEDRFAAIFALFERYGVKINLIQSSAVNLSVCVDDSRRLPEVVGELQESGFRVVYNADMQLFTIRGYTPALFEKYASGNDVYLTQKTRRTLRIVRRKP